MLRLERKVNESVLIEHAGETLEVRLTGIRSGKRAQLAFDGPRSFRIVRDDAQCRDSFLAHATGRPVNLSPEWPENLKP